MSASRVRYVATMAGVAGAVAIAGCSSTDATPFDRTKPPATMATPVLTFPPVIERTLPNGLRLLIVEHHELPVADVIVVVRSGAEADPADKAGLATLTAELLDEGTASRDALAIADQEAFLGVTLGTGGAWDVSSLSLHTTTAQLDSALALLADVALHPAFPAAELERVRKDRLTSLIQLRDQGPAIASQAYASIVFGAAHPYGKLTIGSEKAVSGITRDDLVHFYQTYYRPNNATIIVVGDVKAADIEKKLGAAFGAWEKGTVPATDVPSGAAPSATTVYLIDKPGAAQSSFRIGTIGVPRSTKDYFAITVMNTLLGDAFTSRLNQNLREVHGYTYGAASAFDMRRAAGPFTARAEIVSAKTDSALVQFMKELTAIGDTVPAAELRKTEQYLQLQLPSQFETTTDIALKLIPVVVYDLPVNYYSTYSQEIGKVTQGDVQRVAKQYIDPTHLAIVIVGDRKTVERGLRALKVGSVELRDMAGRPLR